jgi:hypothetical protein
LINLTMSWPYINLSSSWLYFPAICILDRSEYSL